MSIFRNAAGSSPEAAEAYVAAVLHLLGDRDPREVLRGTPETIRGIVDETPHERLTRPGGSGRWSVAEVIAHLCDSELVWSVRLRRVLAEDEPLLEGYDQDLWAERLGYASRNAAEAAAEFEAIRAANLGLLARTDASALERTGRHQERGTESAAHMIRLYAGHDLVHLRQIRRVASGPGRDPRGAGADP